MRYRRAYVIKRLKDRDFSKLEENCSQVVFLYNSDKPLDFLLQEVPSEIGLLLKDFNPIEDVLVLSGPAVLCALAFGILTNLHDEVSIAVFKNNKYEYFRACFGNVNFTEEFLPQEVIV